MYIIKICSDCGKRKVVLKTDDFICPNCGNKSASSFHPIISFGDRDWLVLKQNKNGMLVVSKHLLNITHYYDSPVNIANIDTDWENCSLRNDLNNVYYGTFTTLEKQKILKIRNINHDNHQFNTPGGNHTIDHIFLLSIEQAMKYFKNNQQRKAYGSNNTPFPYWLRSPGIDRRFAAVVRNDGSISINGDSVRVNHYLRPAMWIKL
jgi:hypothetical protein